MKLRDFLGEMSLPTVDNLQQATNYIQRAYEASVHGPANQDVMGGLHAAAEWLKQQPNLGTDPAMIQLAKKAKIAKQKLDASRAPLAKQQPQFSTVRTDTFGKRASV
jgi:hypothetical protein